MAHTEKIATPYIQKSAEASTGHQPKPSSVKAKYNPLARFPGQQAKQTMNDAEQKLIEQAKAGEMAAFEKLYADHYHVVYRYIYYRVGQRPLAEDLTADVFERMVAKIDQYQSTGKPFIAWLYTIAGNLVRNHIKRENRIDWSPLDERDETKEEAVSVQVGSKMVQENLAQALNQLTDEQREVTLLRFLAGQPIAQVAKTLGKTETGIKALQRRAIGALKRILEKEGFHVTK